MKSLDKSQAAVRLLAGLDLNGHTLGDLEFLAAFVRKIALHNCPCPLSTLVKVTLALLRPLDPDETLSVRINDCLEELLAYGDLVEMRDQDDTKDLVTLRVPSVVRVSPHRVLLLGSQIDARSQTSLLLTSQIELHGCARTVSVEDVDAAMSSLIADGYALVTYEEWCHLPRLTTAEDLVAKYARKMASQDSIGSLGDLELLIPETNVKYYRGRWKSAKSQTGMFVAKRARSFGSPTWCCVKLEDGVAVGLVSFPTQSGARGCDEAWHLQQAIDRARSIPQRYSVRLDQGSEFGFLDFYSPIPEWAQRRWNAIGERVDSKGFLFSYRFDSSVLGDEIRFAETRMWVTNDDRTYQ